jgi:hypothetical protein
MITFHTKRDEFLLCRHGVLQNGEIVAEGEVYVSELLMGMPALILIKPQGDGPLLTIQTETVTAVLPQHERVWNQEDFEREMFLITYQEPVSHWKDVFYCHAAHERQAKALFHMAYPEKEIVSIRIQNKKQLKGVI